MPGTVDDTVMEDVPAQVDGSEAASEDEEEVAPRVKIVRTPASPGPGRMGYPTGLATRANIQDTASRLRRHGRIVRIHRRGAHARECLEMGHHEEVRGDRPEEEGTCYEAETC